VVLVFDNDRAGQAAAAKVVELAQEHQVRTRVARIHGEAKDPDEFLRGGGRWDDVLGAARPGWETLLRDAIEDLSARSPADREVGIRRIREVLGQIRDPAERDTYAELAGRLFDIEPKLLLAFEPAPRRQAGGPPGAPDGPAPRPARGLAPAATGNKLSNGVGYLLSVLAVRPEALERVLGILDPADLEEDDRAAYGRVVSAIERGGAHGLGEELEQLTAEEQGLVRRAWAAPPPSVQDEVVDEVVGRIRRQAQRRRALAIIDSLTEAERRGDPAQVEALQTQLNELRERS
jgi:DNA primase